MAHLRNISFSVILLVGLMCIPFEVSAAVCSSNVVSSGNWTASFGPQISYSIACNVLSVNATFTVSNTNGDSGWIAVGLNTGSGMIGTDACIAWYNGTQAQSYIYEVNAPGFNIALDATQTCSGSITPNGRTANGASFYYSFTKAVNVNASLSYYVVSAINSNNPPGNVALNAAQHTAAGATNSAITLTTVQAPTQPPAVNVTQYAYLQMYTDNACTAGPIFSTSYQIGACIAGSTQLSVSSSNVIMNATYCGSSTSNPVSTGCTAVSGTAFYQKWNSALSTVSLPYTGSVAVKYYAGSASLPPTPSSSATCSNTVVNTVVSQFSNGQCVPANNLLASPYYTPSGSSSSSASSASSASSTSGQPTQAPTRAPTQAPTQAPAAGNGGGNSGGDSYSSSPNGGNGGNTDSYSSSPDRKRSTSYYVKLTCASNAPVVTVYSDGACTNQVSSGSIPTGCYNAALTATAAAGSTSPVFAVNDNILVSDQVSLSCPNGNTPSPATESSESPAHPQTSSSSVVVASFAVLVVLLALF